MKCTQVKFSVIEKSLEGRGHANAKTYFAQLAQLAPELYHSLDIQGGELLVQLSDQKGKTDATFFLERRERVKELLANAQQFKPVLMKGCFPVNEELPKKELRFYHDQRAHMLL